MGATSAPVYSGHVFCLGHLLAVSLLTTWILPINAQFTVESMPAHAAEGEDVILLIHNLTGNPIGYIWYKGESLDPDHQIVGYEVATYLTTTGPAYSGQETLYTNGSLLLQNVTTSNSGYYTLQVIKRGFETGKGTGQLHVYTGGESIGLSGGAIAGIVIGVLVVVALAAALGYFLFFRRTSRPSEQHNVREHQPPETTPGFGPPMNHTYSNPRTEPVPTVPIYEEVQDRNTNHYYSVKSRADARTQFPVGTAPHGLKREFQ